MHIDTIYVYLVEQSSSAILDETVWALFASTTLQLPYLQYLELLRPCTEHEHTQSISDLAFQPLIDLRKFRPRWLTGEWSRSTSAIRTDGTRQAGKRERISETGDRAPH